MKRTFVIGDIHGGLRALHQLLERINPQDDDTFIFLGDYVDGWSESAQVIDFLIDMQSKYDCIFIKGNHDAWCEEWLLKRVADSTWLRHGGKMTVQSYGNISREDREKHLDFFERMKLYYVDENNRLFIHAGFTSMHGPEHEKHTPNYNWDRTLWEMAICMDTRIEKNAAVYPKRLKLYHEIFIGHTPTVYYNQDRPMQACNVWNVDTGAAFKGKLSAINIDTKEVFQSDAVWRLYPDEKGRN
jgi:serine/threonine protein phosphatase 1